MRECRLAAIAGVNPSLYESAVVDGANRWQMMWKITIPSILPTILIMLIIRIGNMLEVSFEMIILLYQPATYETADVVNTFIYRQGIQSGQYDLAAAAGLSDVQQAAVATEHLSRAVLLQASQQGFHVSFQASAFSFLIALFGAWHMVRGRKRSLAAAAPATA